ncbi:hypothetical protein PMAYCL1PPCAC_15568, partial [Pristionchus mayeri]
ITLVSSLLCSFTFSTAVAGDRLIMAQTLWRHGARTPRECYPNDPYQESFWGVPWGELVKDGMRQHFELGHQLRRRYIEEKGLVSKTYSRYETEVRSADTPRCIESAMANMAAFYSDSPTFPSDESGWPSSWTPVPVHSRPFDEDRELEVAVSCPRVNQLSAARENQPKFQDFLASKWTLFTAINANSGEEFNVSYNTISHMWGVLRVEKGDFNLTMPEWITDDFYNGLQRANDEAQDYIDGQEGFGLPDDTELLRLRGGFMLKEMVKNINEVVGNTTTTKYFVYSAHDTIQRAILLSLGIKSGIMGSGNPYYASAIALELWMKNGEYFVKILFSPDSKSDLVDYTSLLPLKCSDGLCPLNSFIEYVNEYIPKGAEVDHK